MPDDPDRPHAYLRRRDAVLGEWCVTCGQYEWHWLHQRAHHLDGEFSDERGKFDPLIGEQPEDGAR